MITPEIHSLFQLLALSLANAALSALSFFEDFPFEVKQQSPMKKEIDLAAAQQNIELLEMLEEKTKGNLNREEMQVLHGLLFDLRMKYVEASKRT